MGVVSCFYFCMTTTFNHSITHNTVRLFFSVIMGAYVESSALITVNDNLLDIIAAFIYCAVAVT